jgi:hypothetical protein
MTRRSVWYGHIASDGPNNGNRDHRHDFDPIKSDDIVYHRHPFGESNEIRVREDPISPDAALEDFRAVLAGEISAGRFELR